MRDITEHITNKTELEKSQVLLNSIINSTSDMIWSVNPRDFGLIMFNRGLIEYFLDKRGISIKVGMRPEDLSPTDEYVQIWRGFYRRALEEGSYTTEYNTFSGTDILELRINALKQNHKVIGLSVVGRNITGQKQTEKALLETKKYWQSLVENTSDMITLLDTNANIVYQNPAIKRILGYKPDEPIGKNVSEFVHPEDWPLCWEIFAAYQSSPESIPPLVELRIHHKNGSWRTIETTGEVRINESGNKVAVLTSRDITERKRAEEALRQSEEKFKLLTEKSGVGIYIIQDSKMAYVNPDFAKTFGYLPEEIIGRLGPEDLIHPDDFKIVMRRVSERQDGETERSSIGCKAIKKDGSILYIEAFGMMFAYQGRPAVMGTLIDVTTRKKVEEALQFERDFAESMIETAQTIVLVLDSQGCIVRFNPYMEEISGYALAEVQGKDWFGTFLPERYRERSRKLFQKALEDIYARGNVSPIVTKDGREREIEWYTKTLRDVQGNIVWLLSIGQDITERKQAEESLRYLSTHDRMTGLYNHGFFVEEMARLERGRNFPVSVVLADVDHLKDANDHYGHAAGDALLKRVAQVLTAAFRAEDVVARIGGDEFAVLLPATNSTSAEISLNRVRQIIQENNTTHKDPLIRLSLGVSTAESRAPLSGVLKEADANMYREKRGRDASQ